MPNWTRLEYRNQVGGRDDVQYPMLSAGEHSLHVTVEQTREWLLVLPFRMLRGKCFHAIDGEQKLEVDWLLSPERTVIVKCCDTACDWNKVWSSLICHVLDECNNRPLGWS